MKHIHKFITEDDVNDYKSITNDELKKGILGFGSGFCFSIKGSDYDFDSFLTDEYFDEEIKNFDFRKTFGLPEGDLDDLLEQFREEGFTKYCRAGNWRHSFIKVLNNDGNIRDYSTWTTSFRYVNKWNQESELQEYRIIAGEKDKIMWIECDSPDDKCNFISDCKNIYKISYGEKKLFLSRNNFSTDEYLSYDNDDINDHLIHKFRLEKTIERKKFVFPIDEHLDKRFFYKGPKYNKYFEYMYSYPRNTTILISIQVKNNLFYIEIENITYPLYGYILLDLNEIRIVEAEKIGKISFINKIISSYKKWVSNISIFFDYETRLLTQNDIDELLTALHGNIINRINIIMKRIIFSFKNLSCYKLIIITKKFVYIICLGKFKKELREDSYYSTYGE